MKKVHSSDYVRLDMPGNGDAQARLFYGDLLGLAASRTSEPGIAAWRLVERADSRRRHQRLEQRFMPGLRARIVRTEA